MNKLLLLLFTLCFGNGLLSQTISIETKIGKSATNYTFFKKNKCKVSFETTRPNKKDENILVCIPAAFTNLDNLKLDGIYSVNGVIGNKKAINKTLGGVFYIENNSIKIFQSAKGKLFNDSLLTLTQSKKASFFQQIQCIENGKASKFIDKKIFQRRGIAILADNSVCIIESTEPITLQVFSTDLVLLGVKQLIYTDMGAWDEGWYKNPLNNNLVIIGKNLSQTNKQSNWIVFRK
ncbi:MAG: hypothetical protein H7141_00205 [Burkholderiales bacterium]|nr:hypothetical protein [Bacteroidia bacterium]